jgi:TonB-linked SusC/RagA family outer membrane protein
MQFKHLSKPPGNSRSLLTISMLRIIKLAMLMLFFTCTQVNAIGVSNPPIQVRGKITNQKGEPVQNVSVLIAGSQVGTTTDNEGRYSLTVPSNTASLVISSVGFKTKTVKVGSQTEINVSLDDDVSGLNDVVVIGYGTAKKKDVTGSVSTISSKRLLERQTVNLGQALQNKIAGVQVISQGGGIPGQNPLIRIRGTNSITAGNDPLYVLDGVVGVANPLATLNPNDIQSIDVLKDASATAIYGARGANGVILITSKRGVGGKTQITVGSNVSRNVLQRHVYALNAEQLSYLYLQTMMNAKKFGNVIPGNDFRATAQGGEGNQATNTFSSMLHLFKAVPAGSYSVPLLGADGQYYKPMYDTNWETLMFPGSTSQAHYVSIRGGNENAKFSVSLGANDEKGLMLKSSFKRITSKITGDITATKWLKIATSIGFNKSVQTGDDGITRSATEVWSILPVKYPTDAPPAFAGRWASNFDFKTGEQWWNVLFRRDQIYQQNNVGQVTGSFNATAQITKDLSFKGDFSIDYNNYKNNGYSGKLYGGTGSASISNTQSYFWQNENYFNYNKQIGNHSISAILGLSWQKNQFQGFGASNSIFLSNFYGYSNLGAGAAPRPGVSSNDGGNALNSYFTRANYSYKDKYLLTVTARQDGSSRFGKNNKYGFFPSVGAGWKISEENFMKNVSTFSNLKLRGSWGKTGNQEIGNFQTQQFISTASILQYGSVQTGLVPASVANPDLKWETTTQYDLGLEIGLLKGNINIGVDYYNKLTSDMLLSVPLPLSTTTGSVLRNYGKVENKGWELTFNTVNIATKNFRWTTDLIVTMNRNKVIQLGPTGAPIYQQFGAGNATTIIKVGEPVGSFFGLDRIGTWSTQEASAAMRYGRIPGDLKFKDTNGDGRIDLLTDGAITGRAFPAQIYGLHNTVTYKDFDFNLDIQIVQGVNKAFIKESAEDRQLVSGGLNTSLNAWRPNYQNTKVGQFRPGNGGAIYNYQSFSDSYIITDASYIRGQNASLGYSLSDKLTKRIGLQKIRVYLSAQNFFLRTKAEGYDPEGASLDKNLPLAPNSDKYQYPTPSIYTFGLNVSL